MTKLALITGASKGIGKALADIFARNGYDLILIARTTAELQALQTDLQARYQRIVKILSVDLAQPDCVDVIMNTFKEDMPKLDVLINNAGFGAAKKFTDMTPEELDGMLAVNMVALTKLTYRILPMMVTRKSGKIMNVASLAAFLPGPFMAVYYASKAYVLSLSEAIAYEYQADGITVSVLCPGMTKTDFHRRSGTDKTYLVTKLMPGMSAEAVAQIGYNGLMRGRKVVVSGFSNKLASIFMPHIPNFLLMKVLTLIQKPQK